jgi:hypothetical protein
MIDGKGALCLLAEIAFRPPDEETKPNMKDSHRFVRVVVLKT